MANNLERNLTDNSKDEYYVLNGNELEELLRTIQTFTDNYNYQHSPYKHVICHFAGNTCTLLMSMVCEKDAVESTIKITKEFIDEFVKSLKANYKEIHGKKIKFEPKEPHLVHDEKLDPNNRHSVIASRRFWLD